MWPPLVKVLSATYSFKCYTLVEEKKKEYSKNSEARQLFLQVIVVS